MPVYKDPRNGIWRYRARITLPDGRRCRISGTPATNTKKAAEHAERMHILRKTNPPAAQQVSSASEEVPTFDEYTSTFLKHYASGKPSDLDAKRQIIDAYLSPEIGWRKLDAIVQRDVDELAAAFLVDKSPKTVNNILSVLASLMRLAVRNRVLVGVDATFHVKAAETELESVSQESISKLLEVACPRYRAAILLACDAGLRVGEVRGLEWGDVDELRRSVTVRRSIDTKGRKVAPKSWRIRTVPMSDRLRQALRDVPKTGRTIVTLEGKAKQISYWGIRDGLHNLYTRAGVEPPSLPWHCLRHSFCTSLADAGVAIHLIKELAGHRSISTTLRYMHTGEEAKAEAISKAFGQQVANSPPRKEEKPG